MAIANTTLNILLRLKMVLIKQFLWKPLVRKTHHLKTTQDALLLKILDTNKATIFGKEHNFEAIRSYEDFARTVLVQSYEDLRPYIEKQEKEQQLYLNISQPIMYAETSGTTAKPKYIPILKSTISQYRQSQHTFAYVEYKDIPRVYDGKVLAIVSPAFEGKLESETPYGSMSGLIYQSMPRFVYAKYVVPPKVFAIDDYDLKYYLISAFALAEQDITLIATANPSTMLKINAVICECWDDLVAEVESGNEYGLKPDPKRAKALRALASNKAQPAFADLWPNLKSVTTWMGGSCAVLIPSIKKLLSPSTRIVEMGYLSSEFRGSITVDALNNKSIPTIHENFFEFVERDAWENERTGFLTVEKIEEGKQYYVFATTQNGLYRYFINDIIEVDGRFNDTPTIRFVQKGKGVTNLTGEKLYESQVIAAIQALKREINTEFDFFLMVGCPESLQYSLYVETEPFMDATQRFERYINRLNIEFEAKRKSGRLKQTSIVFLKSGTADIYKKHCINNGQREGQLKVIKLQYQKDCSFSFDKYVREYSEDK
jgi:hypothetical protein